MKKFSKKQKYFLKRLNRLDVYKLKCRHNNEKDIRI